MIEWKNQRHTRSQSKSDHHGRCFIHCDVCAHVRHKAPLELVIGRRNRPHDLFGNQEVEGYLAQLERAVARQLDELGASGSFEAFTFMRRLGHRLVYTGSSARGDALPLENPRGGNDPGARSSGQSR